MILCPCASCAPAGYLQPSTAAEWPAGLQQLADAQDEIYNPSQQAQAAASAQSARETARQRMLRKHLKKKLAAREPAVP